MADYISVVNPATEERVKEILADDSAAVAQKVGRARAAQPTWAAKPVGEKVDLLNRFKALLVENADRLAATLTQETGKPIAQAKGEILATPARIDFFTQAVAGVIAPNVVYRETAEGEVDKSSTIPPLEEIISYDPLGVVANISAWNYPYFVGTNVFVPALLTGNAVLYKPSEIATMTGLAIAGLFYEAGVPEDIFIPVVGAGATGAALLQEKIDGVFFTGSYRTGQKIAITAAPKLIKIQLELGGKDPAYVCSDADIAKAAAGLADGAFYNNGQSCCAVERIYVHTDVYEPFLDSFLQTVQSFTLGDPTHLDTYLGPLSRKQQRSILTAQITDAVSKGATLHCGNQLLERPGFFFTPTVLTEVTHDMSVMREETFGPVIGVQRVSGDEEAIALMNDTDYGLTAAVYSESRDHAVQILEKVNSGSAYWNCCDRVNPRLPWTGRGHSGIGSTLSEVGILAFIQPRSWHLKV
ncbi:MAG: aldehyde dehydrogenase family protein [Cyanobacteria bacterium J06560_2]